MQKELPNGQANWRLASGEQRWVSPQRWRRNGNMEGSFDRPFPSYRQRRERGSGPGPARQPTARRSGGTTARRQVPYSVPLTGGPQLGF
jgi:hypothetical protein